MAAIALGMMYLPRSLYLPASQSSRRTRALPAANANIGFGVTNALDNANHKVNHALELTQEQKNMMLLDAYGERSSLSDMERALAGVEAKSQTQKNRNMLLEEAYGDRSSLHDLERAMQIYEVQ